MDILSYTRDQIAEYMKENGEPEYRAGILFSWLHQKQADSFEVMTDIPKTLRSRLEADAYIGQIKPVRKQISRDGTVKYLFRLSDGNCIETVAIFYKTGITVCVSSQVGCGRGCSFCASASGGLVRNLSVSEMLLQVYEAGRDLGGRISNLVLMGIGEPFDNFCNVMAFCDIISDTKGMNLGRRSITISTCGVVEGIDRLAANHMQYTLSVSLHAAKDALRSRLMPVNRIYPLSVLMESCRGYCRKTGRRITFEYAVIAGVNDSAADAGELALLLSGIDAHINLIPVNSVGNNEYFSSREDASDFREKLVGLGLKVTVRRTLGGDVDASCGQLRRQYEAGAIERQR